MPIGAVLTWDDAGLRSQYRPEPEGTYLVRRIRGGKRKRRQVRVGAADRSLTSNAGMAAVAEVCDRLGVIGALDAAAGPIKQRDRGFRRRGAAVRDRGGAAGRGGFPDRAGPPA